MLGTDAGIVETRRNRMTLDDLAVIVHQQVGAVAVQHAGAAAGDGSRVLGLGPQAEPRRLDTVDLDLLVVEERMEQAHGVGAAADGRHQRIRQTALALQHLGLGLAADHRLEVAHHLRIGMRAGHGADAVEGVLDIGHPVAQRLVERVLQGPRAGLCGNHLGTQQLHAEDVRLLPLHVDFAHVDDAFETEAGAGRGGGHAMLAGTGLGDDALLAHPPRQQDLAHHVVDLVGAGMVQFVALEVDLGAAQVLGKALGKIQRARAAHIVFEEGVEFGLEGLVGLGVLVGLFKLENERHQGFGDETAAVNAEQAVLVRARAEGIGRCDVHETLAFTAVLAGRLRGLNEFPDEANILDAGR